jgi:hypothetical protein
VEYWAHRHKRKTNSHLLSTVTFEDNALQIYIWNILVWWWFIGVYTRIFSGIAKIVVVVVVVVVYICINIGNSKRCTNVCLTKFPLVTWNILGEWLLLAFSYRSKFSYYTLD